MSESKHPPARGLARSAFLRVRGGPIATLRLDPPGPSPAMIRAQHASLTHLEHVLPEPLRALRAGLSRLFDAAPDHETAVRGTIELLASRGLEVDRRDEPRASIRRHPAARLRPRPEHRLLDHELLGLEHGLRRVAKRMCPPGAAADRAARFEELGFAARWFGVTTHGAQAAEREVILVARDGHALAEAERVERALVRAATERADDPAAVRDMGALLGYPSCCVERFVALRARDDASLAGALLGPLGVGAPFATAFTVPPFTLVSHAPCSPWCEATQALVEAVLAATDADTRAAYARSAQCEWGIDERGFLVRGHRGLFERMDPADPELACEAIERPAPSALHWHLTPSA